MAELLYSEGIHNQKDKFLKLFLKEIGCNDLKLKNPIAYSEYTINNNRRIDIVIEDDDFIIGIEAKIYSDDRKLQLKDYYDYLKNKKEKFYLFYLTLDGHSPSKDSLEDLNENEIICISFKYEILNFIEKCIKEVVDIPNLRDSLLIYKDLLEKLTNTDNEKENEMIDKILNNKENVEATFNLIQSYEKAWSKKEYDFWCDLYDKIEDKVSNKWNDGDEIFYFREGYSVFYKNRDNNELLEENEAIEEIKKLRFSNNQENNLGIAFKRDYNAYTIYVVLGYVNSDDCSWLGIQIKKENKFLSPNRIIEFFKGKNIQLNFDFKDDYSVYDCFYDLTFASKNNLKGSFDLFDNKEYKKLIDDLSKKMSSIINEIEQKLD